MKNWLMLKLYRITMNWSIFHQAIRLFYLLIFLPVFIFITKKKFPYVTQVIPRNSLLEKKRFNAFFSDIDLKIVVPDDRETKNLLQYFIKVKAFFPMLDIPEVYFESEYGELSKILQSSSASTVNAFWHIRKINWNLQKVSKTLSSLEKEKLERSIKYSYSKAVSTQSMKDLHLKDIRCLPQTNITNTSPTLCFFSPFLETNQKHSLKIILSLEEFIFLDYLMPDRSINDYMLRDLKTSIINHEKLITLASLRIDEALGKVSSEKKLWVNFLKNQIS